MSIPERRVNPQHQQSLGFPLLALTLGAALLGALAWGAFELFGSFRLPFTS